MTSMLAVPVHGDEAPKSTLPNVPHVFWASDPVLPNDTVMAFGEDMDGVTEVRLSRLPDTAPTDAMATSEPKIASWENVKPLQVTPRAVKFVVPAAWKAGVFACSVVAATS